MSLKSWRTKQDLTLAEAAAKFGLGGPNPARSYQRIETGESRADADLVDVIRKVTGGKVTPADMHETRLEYLRQNDKVRPFEPIGAGAG